MKKTVVALGLAVVMFLGVAYVYAQSPGFGPGHKAGMPCQEGWGPEKGLSLAPEQKTKFQELRRKFNEENAQLIGTLVTKRLELRSLWTDPKADSKAIMDKEKELRELRNQMSDKIVQMKLESRKFLTPEQITELRPGFGMNPGFGRGRMMSGGAGMGPGIGMCN